HLRTYKDAPGGMHRAARAGRLLLAPLSRAVSRAGARLARAPLRRAARLENALARRLLGGLRRIPRRWPAVGRAPAGLEPGRRRGARHLGRRGSRHPGLRAGSLLVPPRRASLRLAVAPRAPDAPQRRERGRVRRVLPASARRAALHHLGGAGVLPAARALARGGGDRLGVPRLQRRLPARQHPHAALARLPRPAPREPRRAPRARRPSLQLFGPAAVGHGVRRSEEHTSELQSLTNLVCRLLLGKKKGMSANSHAKSS